VITRSLSLVVALLGASVLHAADRTTPGLEVGDKAAGLTLKNSTCSDVAPGDLLKRVLVAPGFYRSADGCPFCKKQLQDREKNRAAIKASGVRLIGWSYDAPAANAAAATKLGPTFPLHSDIGSKTIEAYRIRTKEAKGRAEGVPNPAVFIVDRTGVIRAKLTRDGYRERPESAEIIAAARSLH